MDPSEGGPVVLAGFEPFSGRRRNRSWEIVRRVPSGPDLVRVQLPVDFERLDAALGRIVETGPRALLLVGEASVREVRVEGVALNLLDSEIPDNSGRVARAEVLVAGGPLALPARWNPHEVAAALETEGVPVEVSYHAGTFACNAALFWALLRLPAACRVGFLHLPRHRWPRGPRRAILVKAIRRSLSELVHSP